MVGSPGRKLRHIWQRYKYGHTQAPIWQERPFGRVKGWAGSDEIQYGFWGRGNLAGSSKSARN